MCGILNTFKKLTNIKMCLDMQKDILMKNENSLHALIYSANGFHLYIHTYLQAVEKAQAE